MRIRQIIERITIIALGRKLEILIRSRAHFRRDNVDPPINSP